MGFLKKSVGGKRSARSSFFYPDRVGVKYGRGHRKFRSLDGRYTGKRYWMINK